MLATDQILKLLKSGQKSNWLPMWNVKASLKSMTCKIVDNILRHFDNIEVCTQTVLCFIRDQRMGNGDYNVRKMFS